ncbi:hypothetical protein CONLIGDRAFT_647168 [Coniochaeta ligniaria NRRL 30616]|uniref:Uncharacterized protein n=1 Tax=Coniochaeta ligniaria NRRL 30616 TaxID=1408157 RepID=A0A1J7J150_9PEZI|nr:hypothetical protein CONLIGDRAFT_647168 [Coniochaeta ligniaria NRRL 30616]
MSITGIDATGGTEGKSAKGGHQSMGDSMDAYLVCHDCQGHPSGGPDGTGPDGSFAVANDAQDYAGDEVSWQWDSTNQRYFCVDANGNITWADDQGQSSSSAGQ